MSPAVSAVDLEQNAILASLPMAERTRLASKFQPYQLKHEVLAEVGTAFRDAYFPTNGLISIVAELKRIALGEIAPRRWDRA